MFADGRLDLHLRAAQEQAGISAAVSALRVLHAVLWMRHRPTQLRHHCPGSHKAKAS